MYRKMSEKDSQSEKNKDTPKKPSSQEDVEEIGGPKGKEPTRYGDWEIGGKCVDF